MMPFDSFATAAWNQFWQVTALIVVIGALTSFFCRQRPHLAYVLWLLVLLKCLTPPVWSSPTSLFSWSQARDERGKTIADSGAQMPKLDGNSLTELALPDASDESLVLAPSVAAFDDETRVASMVAACWLGGMLLCGGGVALHGRRFRRILRMNRLAVDPALIAETASLARRLGFRRPVRIMVVSSPHGPAALGLWSPTVLLPKALADKSSAQREPVLAHELVHFRRGDHLFGFLQVLVQIVWWFHPLVWWANRQASRVVERCCDEEVIASLGCAPAAYARCLLDVLELRHNLQAVYLAPGMRPAEVTALRLENIMKHANGFHRRTPKWCWAILALALAIVLPGREMVLSQDQSAPEKPAATPANDKKAEASPPAPLPKVNVGETNSKSKRMVDAIRLKFATAADAATAINDFFEKRQQSAQISDKELANRPVVTAEPVSNSLFVSANPMEFSEIKRLVNVIDIVSQQFAIEMVICEGEPTPTLREAVEKGTVNVLSRPQSITLANQTAIVNIGQDIPFPAGSGERRNVGTLIQITAGRANDKQVPVRLAVEFSAINDDRTTLTLQHVEHSAAMPLDRPVRIRCGKMNSGKELWIVTNITEVTSREQAERLLSPKGPRAVDSWRWEAK